jgi:isoquinoline 1-oxidoreductase beta subunit
MAEAAGEDPYEFRRRLLTEHPRHRRVLEIAAERANWGGSLPQGHRRGIAVAEAFGSYVAEVVEASIDGGRVRVHRVVCAVDCGQVVNPDTVQAQMEGGIVYGLTAALYGEISLEDGRVQQSNFHDYRVLRMDEMPRVEVHLVPSGDPHGGVGEPGVPPAAPALCNALYTLTGKRIRRLPIKIDA